jgi:hypothetical protein
MKSVDYVFLCLLTTSQDFQSCSARNTDGENLRFSKDHESDLIFPEPNLELHDSSREDNQISLFENELLRHENTKSCSLWISLLFINSSQLRRDLRKRDHYVRRM